MRNEECSVAFSQIRIREGFKTFGYWEVEIQEDGIYQIETRRWPKSESRSIAEGIDGDDVVFKREAIHKDDYSRFTGGKKLDITYAHISLQGNKKNVEVSENDTSSVFNIKLRKGKTHLEAWFSDSENNAMTSAYYIDVNKL